MNCVYGLESGYYYADERLNLAGIPLAHDEESPTFFLLQSAERFGSEKLLNDVDFLQLSNALKKCKEQDVAVRPEINSTVPGFTGLSPRYSMQRLNESFRHTGPRRPEG